MADVATPWRADATTLSPLNIHDSIASFDNTTKELALLTTWFFTDSPYCGDMRWGTLDVATSLPADSTTLPLLNIHDQVRSR